MYRIRDGVNSVGTRLKTLTSSPTAVVAGCIWLSDCQDICCTDDIHVVQLQRQKHQRHSRLQRSAVVFETRHFKGKGKGNC